MSQSSATPLTPPVGPRDHVQGSSSAGVTLVAYGDYQCPFSRAVHPVIKQLHQQFGGELRWAFRHFPLTNKHPDAQRAAEAAEAAGAQGKFWEMHEYLFEHQSALDDGSLNRAAETLGLDTAKFAREVSGRVYADRVGEDRQSGIESGASGTPTIFINGVRSDEDDEDDFETLKAKIEAAIGLAKGDDCA